MTRNLFYESKREQTSNSARIPRDEISILTSLRLIILIITGLRVHGALGNAKEETKRERYATSPERQFPQFAL